MTINCSPSTMWCGELKKNTLFPTQHLLNVPRETLYNIRMTNIKKHDLIKWLESLEVPLADTKDTAETALQLATSPRETALMMVMANSVINDIKNRIDKGTLTKWEGSGFPLTRWEGMQDG